MHPGYGVRMHGEGEVLVYSTVAPEDAAGVGIVALEGAGPVQVAQEPAALVGSEAYRGRGPSAALAFVQPPASEMVRAGDDPGAIDSVTHAWFTKWPISVVTRRRSPVVRPSRFASRVWIQTGFRCEISARYFALPLRVWIKVGRRKVGRRSISPLAASRASRWTWLRM
jgi:hypothetical protein